MSLQILRNTKLYGLDVSRKKVIGDLSLRGALKSEILSFLGLGPKISYVQVTDKSTYPG